MPIINILKKKGKQGGNMELLGKIKIRFKIEAKTGLSIGAGRETFEIGGLDNPVIKTPDGVPYIPGSSLKGKIRSLIERKKFDLNEIREYYEIKDDKKKKEKKEELERKGWKWVGNGFIHVCDKKDCEVCRTFGRPAEVENSEPTRVYIRDSFLEEKEFKEKFKDLFNSGLYTETKWENVIDRLTSSANPRHFERVPAGAIFSGEFIFNVYDKEDEKLFDLFLQGLALLEDDYLGSSGSRGYGKIKFFDFEVYPKEREKYGKITEKEEVIRCGDLEELIKNKEEIFKKIFKDGNNKT